MISNVDENGYIKSNLGTDLNYVSKYYTPDIKVSYLSLVILKLLKTTNTFNDYSDVPSESLIGLLQKSNLKYRYPKLYLLARVTFLESFSLSYAVDSYGNEKEDYLQYCTVDMVNQTIQNINYLVSELQEVEKEDSDEDFTKIIGKLQELAITVGYLVATINVYNNQDGLGAYSHG